MKLLYFFSQSCGPCKALSYIIGEVEKEFSEKIEVMRYDVEKYFDKVDKFYVKSVPTLILVDDDEKSLAEIKSRTKSGISQDIQKVIDAYEK